MPSMDSGALPPASGSSPATSVSAPSVSSPHDVSPTLAIPSVPPEPLSHQGPSPFTLGQPVNMDVDSSAAAMSFASGLAAGSHIPTSSFPPSQPLASSAPMAAHHEVPSGSPPDPSLHSPSSSESQIRALLEHQSQILAVRRQAFQQGNAAFAQYGEADLRAIAESLACLRSLLPPPSPSQPSPSAQSHLWVQLTGRSIPKLRENASEEEMEAWANSMESFLRVVSQQSAVSPSQAEMRSLWDQALPTNASGLIL